MSNFHDKYYDGIILKFPSWFIRMNNLNPLISEIEKRLKDENILSHYHPDHISNLYEIENVLEKSEMVKQEKIEEEKSRERWGEYNRKLYNVDIIRTEYSFYILSTIYENEIWIGEKYYKEDDIVTKKCHIKSSFKKLFVKYLKSLNEKELLEYFNGVIPHPPTKILDIENCLVYSMSGYGGLIFRYKQLYALLPINRGESDTKYYKIWVEQDKEGNFSTRYTGYDIEFFKHYTFNENKQIFEKLN